MAALQLDALPQEARATIEQGEALMGFVPNDALIMAHKPQLLTAFLQLVKAVYAPSELEPALKRLIGMVASRTAECHYCEVHTANSAHQLGVPLTKLTALCDFANSDQFTAAEKAALQVAAGAARVPNGVTDIEFAALDEHYSEKAKVDILSVISLFGFLNRWNSTLHTTVEDTPNATWRQLDTR
ncbi:MAG: carboxymuconolactone decarboxylase family protein [Gammaproteobacteria bacterium]